MNATPLNMLTSLVVAFCLLDGWRIQAQQQPPVRLEVAELRVRADQGNARAQTDLGIDYDLGFGVQKDPTEAVKWFRKAAEQGDAQGQYLLGECYANGRGVKQDESEAVKLYHLAAEQGHILAQRNLGARYTSGQGVPQNGSAAVIWSRRAAEQGDIEAQMNLGYIYLAGRGVTKDDIEMVKWYRHAAERGYGLAQNYLGHLLATGTGVRRDEAEAYKWWLLAGAQGIEEAKKSYQDLEKRLTPAPRAIGQRMAREFQPIEGPVVALPVPREGSSQAGAPASTGTKAVSSQPLSREEWEVIRLTGVGACVLALLAALYVRQRASKWTNIRPSIALRQAQPMPRTLSHTPLQPALTTPTGTHTSFLYVLLDGNEHGPISQQQALDMVRQGQLQGESPAWKEGLAGWKRLDQVLDVTLALPPAALPPPTLNPAQNVVRGHKPFALTQPVDGARPGIRFLARFVDIVLFSSCFGFVVALVAPELLTIEPLILSLLIPFLWCFVETALLATWGLTPGKAFLKVHVRNADGSKLGYRAALSRASDVWISGLGLALPFINLFAMNAAYNRLATTGSTSWDKKGSYRVTHGTIGPARIVCAIVVVVLAFVFGVLDSQVTKGVDGR